MLEEVFAILSAIAAVGSALNWIWAARVEVPHPVGDELNPVERVWLYLRERFLSHRLHADQGAVINAACKAWTRLTPERLRSLCNYPWIKQVTS